MNLALLPSLEQSSSLHIGVHGSTNSQAPLSLAICSLDLALVFFPIGLGGVGTLTEDLDGGKAAWGDPTRLEELPMTAETNRILREGLSAVPGLFSFPGRARPGCPVRWSTARGGPRV